MITRISDKDSLISQAILEALSVQSRRAPLPVVVMVIILCSMSYGRIQTSVLTTWVVFTLAVLTIRYFALRSLVQNDSRSGAEKLRISTYLSVLGGLAHGISLFMFPLFTEPERALQTVLLLGLATGTVATSLGYRNIFLAYSIPTVGGVALCWTLFPASNVPLWTSYALSFLVLYLGAALYLLARENFSRFAAQVNLSEELKLALDSAQSANRAKTRFLAAASHDLRQPLHTLSLFGAALQMRNLDPKSREIAEQLNSATKDLALELDALLDISKLDAGVLAVELNRFELGPVIKQIVDSYFPLAQQKNVELSYVGDVIIFVDSDRVLLERIVRNLVDNAVKYTDTGNIVVKVTRNAPLEEFSISIADTGRGIPEDQTTLVFEEFYQVANPERDRSKGLGLGLSIVQRMVALLEGRIQLTSKVGVGTVTTVTLHGIAQHKSSLLPAEINKKKFDTSNFKGLRVLVVDDEASVRLGMQTLLNSVGCIVTAVSNQSEAVHAASRLKFDIMLADFRLTGSQSGINVINAVRLIIKNLPALLISGDTAPDRLREAQSEGIPLLHKPVQIESLFSAIEALTARSQVKQNE